MNSDHVWVSTFFNDSRYIRGGKVDWDAPGWFDIKERRQPPKETLPLPMYANEPRETYRQLPPAFAAGGGLNVCAQLADVFRRFDLGTGGVVPIQIFQFDRNTMVDTEYFLVTVVDRKEAFLPIESWDLFAARFGPIPTTNLSLPLYPKDGDIAVSQSACTGPDLWFDSTLRSALFMSGHLTAAVKEAGFAGIFNFVKCRVIRHH